MSRIAFALRETLNGMRLALVAAGVVAAAPVVSMAGTEIFDFEVPGVPGPIRPEVVPAPILTNANVADVANFFQNRKSADPNATLAVKVFENLSNPAIQQLFDTYQVNYVFADYEPGTPGVGRTDTRVRNLVNFLDRTSSWSSGLKVGNYEYRAKDAKTNMHNVQLYPGSPQQYALSESPNVRSSLFAAPIQRFADLTNKRLDYTNIPYVTRFNNWGNSALDTDGNASNGYRFETTDQLLSRGDFSAQVLHYRMRGADTIHLFESGVVNYSKKDLQDDALAGWNLPAVQSVFEDEDVEFANLDEEVHVGTKGNAKQDLTEGVVWSGVYVPGEKLFILASNLRDDEVNELEFGKVDKASVVESPGDDLYLASIDSNDHVLFEFNYQKQGSKTWWTLVSTTEVFDDDDRSGVGIPEPAAVGLLALAAPLLARRRRATHGG